MNLRQRRFVAEYLKDGNGARAYRAAGYSQRAAEVKACQLLTIPSIAAAVAEGADRQMRRIEVSADRVLKEVALKAFANMSDYVVFENGTARVRFVDMDRMKSSPIAEITIDEELSEGVSEEDNDGETIPSKTIVRRTRFKLADSIRALELLGKYLKLWTDKTEHVLGEDPCEALIAEFRAARELALAQEQKVLAAGNPGTIDDSLVS